MTISITAYTNDGCIEFLAGTSNYKYSIDAARLPLILRVAKHNVGKAFNMVKSEGTLINTKSTTKGENTMTTNTKTMRAMNYVTLIKGFTNLGYKPITGVADSKGNPVPKKFKCPDCDAVNRARAARSNTGFNETALRKSAIKAYVFEHASNQTIAACPCGFRKTQDGKISHSSQWHSEFSNVGAATNATPVVNETVNANTIPTAPPITTTGIKMCKGITKNGKPCPYKAKPGSDYCGIHSKAVPQTADGKSF